MTPDTRRVIDRIKQNARHDARTMGSPYSMRLDAHAAALALGDWDHLMEMARQGHEIDDAVMLMARGVVGGRVAYVDADFAMKLQTGADIDPEDAYREMLMDTVDVAAVAEALARPRSDDATEDYRLRRDVLLRALWRGTGGKDQAVQAAAEMVAVLAHLAAQPSLHDDLHAWGLMPRLWMNRPLHAYMVRDMLLLHEAHATSPAKTQDQSRREHSDRWWRGLSQAVARHLPVGVSGWLHAMIAGTIHCGHAGCRHDHGGDADIPGRTMAIIVSAERVDHVCDHIRRPPHPSPERAAEVRLDYEAEMQRRWMVRRGGRPSDHAHDASAALDRFLAENERAFGDPCWPWDAAMARRFGDMDLDHQDGVSA